MLERREPGALAEAVALTAEELRARGVPEERAQALAAGAATLTATLPSERRWDALCRAHLGPDVPFPAQLFLHDRVFADWDEARGPRPAWTPTPAEAAATNVAALARELGFASYDDLWRWSVRERGAYWGRVIERMGIRFARPPECILDDREGPARARWLPGARLNIVASCFQAPPDAVAIVAGAAGAPLRRVSYADLAGQVARAAAALRALGLSPGAPVGLALPLAPEAVAIYLGAVAAGLTVVAVPETMSPAEIGARLRLGGAQLVVTAHEVLRGHRRAPLYAKVVEAGAPRAVVLDAAGATLRDGDVRWDDVLASAPAAPLRPVPVDTEAASAVLFSSGTTGDPKAIPWTHLTPIKAAADAAFHLDVRAGDVVAWPTSLGWMMGPWLIYAALLNRATMALFQDAPTLRAFGEFVAAARVNVLGVVPTIARAWRRFDRMRGLDWSSIRCFGSTGEASNPVDALYLMSLAGWRPIVEYCGGTELGGGYVAGTLVQPASPATFTTPALGADLVVLDEEGRPADEGEVFLVPPLFGASQRLLHHDHDAVYFAGAPRGPAGQALRRHGDRMRRLPGGRLRALGRVDDTMNLGGVKVASAEIERVLDLVPGVRRTEAIAVEPPGGGPSELVVYAVAEEGHPRAALLARMQQELMRKLSELFRISELVLVDDLPVTVSNKVMRRELRRAYADRRA